MQLASCLGERPRLAVNEVKACGSLHGGQTHAGKTVCQGPVVDLVRGAETAVAGAAERWA